MKDQKLHLGMSPLTERIYLGKQKKGEWVGKKRDITSEFIQVMKQRFPINTMQTISVNGHDEYRVIVVDMHKEIIISKREKS